MPKLVQITRIGRSEFCESILGMMERDPGIEPQIPLRHLSKYYSERIITPDEEPVPDCVECGACCVNAFIVPMSRAESERVGDFVEIVLDEAEQVTIGRVLPRSTENDNCVHLGGTPGVKVGCTIYESRPSVCRVFDAGSDRCHGYRRFRGIEPPLDEAVVARVLESGETPNLGRIPAVHIELTSRKVGIEIGPDGEQQVSERLLVTATAHWSDGTQQELHSYDPQNEEWFEHELEGITLAEAFELIEKRKQGSNELNV